MLVAARRMGLGRWLSRTHWRLDACLCLILLVLFPAFSWLQGQHVNYDALNYHLYASLIASTLVGRVCLWERIIKGCRQPLVLHADSGNAMRAATLEARLEKLGLLRSFSRPRVSNDNPYSESLFFTVKYRPDYPNRPFTSTAEACE